ncbi:hypothetical protein BDCR2A_01807 [Borrelia duttonii CR2A]|uniref:Uncharacterized protein n=1 Tax=Borrelia duttonii CR2A TaxID=1432657 RepID=W6TF34_9SPIR|nr:hypothetical protein BDCR2A_01807 [Borrelia duttonii CR2A]
MSYYLFDFEADTCGHFALSIFCFAVPSTFFTVFLIISSIVTNNLFTAAIPTPLMKRC